MRAIKHIFRLFALTFLYVLPQIVSLAQDIHFSQFNFSPLTQTPAFTGLFSGDIRLVANYRNQWFTVPVSYQTAAISGDGFVRFGSAERVALGIGGMFYFDQAGDGRFTSLQSNLSLSLLLSLDRRMMHTASLGISAGVGSRSVRYQYLYFDNQYNGDRFDNRLQSGEDFPDASFYYPDVSVGVAYRYRKSARQNVTFGIGMHHLNEPRQSFYNDKFIKLNVRYNFNLNIRWQISRAVDIVPEALFQWQDKKYDFSFGAHTKTYLTRLSRSIVCINSGFYYRNNDAVYFLLGMDYNDWRVNLTFDANVSGFQRATQNVGAIEVSLIYITSKIRKVKDYNTDCPIF
jgi:type IX secretion system PorP/SprF family membrane protein